MKRKTSQISQKPKIGLMYEVSSKSDNGKGLKKRGKIRERNQPTDVGKPRWTRKWPSLRLCNFFSRRNFDRGFEISSVGILDISPYPKSEQHRVAGNHLTRHAKNGYNAVGILATLMRGPPSFW